MFWIKFGLLVLIVFLFNLLIRICLRRLFKIERDKQKWLSYKHINKLHRKVDWTVSVITLIILVVALYFLNAREYSINAYLITGLLLTLPQIGVKAFFEWRYSKVQKLFILTVSDMLIFTIAILSVIQLDLLN